MQQVELGGMVPMADSSANESRRTQSVSCASDTVVQMTRAHPPNSTSGASSVNSASLRSTTALPTPGALWVLTSRMLTARSGLGYRVTGTTVISPVTASAYVQPG